MKRRHLAGFIAWALMVPAVAAPGEQTEQKPVAFRAEAKVVVDTAGKLVNIEPSKDLPEPVRGYIIRQVSTWHFDPPGRNGISGEGVTYLRLGACAVPTQGGYRMAIDYKGNGPGIPGGTLPPPPYPKAAMRAGVDTTMIVTHVVEVDGRSTLENIEFVGGEPKFGRDFSKVAQDWVKHLRYLPERLNGAPVRTRIRTPLDFVVSDAGFAKAAKEHRQSTDLSPECRSADGMLSVALDSPVRLVQPGG